MTRVLGCDTSFWNGKMAYGKMKSAGAEFVYVKASQMTIDTQFKNYWPAAKDAGLLRGAYHYLDWRMSEMVQAKMFCDLLKDDPGELPPVCDFESQYMAPEPAVANGKLWNFLQEVEQRLGRVPMIYTGYYYWLQYSTPNIGWAKYPLWLAWYAPENWVKVPPPWAKWTFWQYTGNGNGPQYGSQGLSMDMNWFNGDIAALRAFANSQIVPPVTPPTPPQPAQPPHSAICPTCGQLWPSTPVLYPVYRVKTGKNPLVHYPNYSSPTSQYIMAGTLVNIDTQSCGYGHMQPITGFPEGGWLWMEFLELT